MSEICNRHGERIEHHFHPAEKRDSLVIIAHGLTGNMDRPLLVATAEGLAARGWPCLRISFSGNGGSDGRFENSNLTRQVDDLRSVLDSIPEDVRVAYVGHSMGAAVGVLCASKDPRIRVLVSLAGMTHTQDFVRREFGNLLPDKDCMWDQPACPLSSNFVNDLHAIGSTLRAAATVKQPWLLIHGEADDVVPPQDSRDALSATNAEKILLEIPGAGHLFDEMSFQQIVDPIDSWLSHHLSNAG
jgi:pimeloyl-ACP methyl ester carboxylesterase